MDMTAAWFQLKQEMHHASRAVCEGSFAFAQAYCTSGKVIGAQEKSKQAIFFGHEAAALTGYYGGKFMKGLTYPLAYVIGRACGASVKETIDQREECVQLLLDGENPQAIDCYMFSRESKIMADASQEYDVETQKENYWQRAREQETDEAVFMSFVKEIGARATGSALGFAVLLWGLNKGCDYVEGAVPRFPQEQKVESGTSAHPSKQAQLNFPGTRPVV